MDCRPPGSSVRGISQAGILEWLLFPSPGDLPDSGIPPISLPLSHQGKPSMSLALFKKMIYCYSFFFMRGQNRIPLELPINKDELTFYPSCNILCLPKNGDHLNSPHSLWFVDFKNLSVSPFGIKIVCLIIINLKCLTATQILSRHLDIWIRNSGPQERVEGKRYKFTFHHIGLFFLAETTFIFQGTEWVS